MNEQTNNGMPLLIQCKPPVLLVRSLTMKGVPTNKTVQGKFIKERAGCHCSCRCASYWLLCHDDLSCKDIREVIALRAAEVLGDKRESPGIKDPQGTELKKAAVWRAIPITATSLALEI